MAEGSRRQAIDGDRSLKALWTAQTSMSRRVEEFSEEFRRFSTEIRQELRLLRTSKSVAAASTPFARDEVKSGKTLATATTPYARKPANTRGNRRNLEQEAWAPHDLPKSGEENVNRRSYYLRWSSEFEEEGSLVRLPPRRGHSDQSNRRNRGLKASARTNPHGGFVDDARRFGDRHQRRYHKCASSDSEEERNMRAQQRRPYPGEPRHPEFRKQRALVGFDLGESEEEDTEIYEQEFHYRRDWEQSVR